MEAAGGHITPGVSRACARARAGPGAGLGRLGPSISLGWLGARVATKGSALALPPSNGPPAWPGPSLRRVPWGDDQTLHHASGTGCRAPVRDVKENPLLNDSDRPSRSARECAGAGGDRVVPGPDRLCQARDGDSCPFRAGLADGYYTDSLRPRLRPPARAIIRVTVARAGPCQ